MPQRAWVSVPSTEHKEVVVEVSFEASDPSASDVDALLQAVAESQFKGFSASIDGSCICLIDSDGNELDALPDCDSTSDTAPLRVVFTREGLSSFGINELRSMAVREGIKAKGTKQQLIEAIYASQHLMRQTDEESDAEGEAEQPEEPAEMSAVMDDAQEDDAQEGDTQDGSSAGYETPDEQPASDNSPVEPESPQETAEPANGGGAPEEPATPEAAEVGEPEPAVATTEHPSVEATTGGEADGKNEVEPAAVDEAGLSPQEEQQDLTDDEQQDEEDEQAQKIEHHATGEEQTECEQLEEKHDDQAGAAVDNERDRQEPQTLPQSAEDDEQPFEPEPEVVHAAANAHDADKPEETVPVDVNNDDDGADDASNADSVDTEFTIQQLRLLVTDLTDRAWTLLSREEAMIIQAEHPPPSPTKTHGSAPASPSSSVSSRRGQMKPVAGPRRATPATPATPGQQRPYSPRREASSIPTPVARSSKSIPVVATPSTSRIARPAATASSSTTKPRPGSSDSQQSTSSSSRPAAKATSSRPPLPTRSKTTAPGAATSTAAPAGGPTRPISPRPPATPGASSTPSTSAAGGAAPPSAVKRPISPRPPASSAAGGPPSAVKRPLSPKPSSSTPAMAATSAASQAAGAPGIRPRSPRPPPSAAPSTGTPAPTARPAPLNRSATTRTTVAPVRAGSAGERPAQAQPTPATPVRRASVDSPASVSSDSARKSQFGFEHTRTHSASDAADLTRPASSGSISSGVTSTVPFSEDSPMKRRGSAASNDSETSVDSKLSGVRSMDSHEDPSANKKSTANVIRGAKPPAGRSAAEPRIRPRSPVPPSASRSASQSDLAATTPASKRTPPVGPVASKVAAPSPGMRPSRSISQPEIRTGIPKPSPVSKRPSEHAPVAAPHPAPASAPVAAPTPVAASAPTPVPAPVPAPVAVQQPREPEPLPGVFDHITGGSARSTQTAADAAKALPVVFPVESRTQAPADAISKPKPAATVAAAATALTAIPVMTAAPTTSSASLTTSTSTSTSASASTTSVASTAPAANPFEKLLGSS